MARAIGTWAGLYRLHPTGERGLWTYEPDPTYPLTYTAIDGKKYIIALIMDTDGATIPRIFWWLPGLCPYDWFEAAILHDALWEARYSGKLMTSFWRANRLLQEAIVAQGWSRALAWLMFWCVTLFGWYWWIAGERGTQE